MPFNTFPKFGEQLKRLFEVHENCYDCAEFYDGCMGWRASKGFAYEGFNRLPNVMPGMYGQQFPASRRSECAEYQPAGRYMAAGGDTCAEAAGLSHKTHRAKTRTCGCGAILLKGKRLCDQCRTENRQQTKREYMRKYMARQRSAVDAGSDVPFPATATLSTQGSGGDLSLTGLWPGVPAPGQTSVLTEGIS